MAEAAFSEDGKYYSAISADGRLKIWDTETNILKQEYTPDLHLTAPPSCLQWIKVSISGGQSQKQGKKRASHSESETQCIALGTSNGKILIYSVAQAKIEAVLERGSSKVTALDWNRKYGLYSCSRDDFAVEWDLQSGKPRHKYKIAVDTKSKQGSYISAIKIVPHKLDTPAHYLVAASWQVRLWRLCKGSATVIKTLGHNASQTALLMLAKTKNDCWLIEGSQNERLLSFWDVTIAEDHEPQTNGDDTTPTPTKKNRKKSLTNVPTITNASYNFVLEDAPRIVDVDLKEEDGATRLSLAAATRSGVVHYYAHSLNGSSIKPHKPSVTLYTTTPDAVPLQLQCCRLQPSGDLLLGYSNGPLMTFENVSPDLSTRTQVLIRGDGKQKKSKQPHEAAKARSEQDGSNAQIVEPLGGVANRKRPTPGGRIEVPMEARLANLAIDVKSRSTAAVNENQTKLLVQGLHSKDRSILKMVLPNNDPGVATRTVASLPAEYVPALLSQLALMATSNTSQCAAVCTWLQALVRRHSALLLALVSSQRGEELSQLLAIFTHRRSHLCQLMNLKGRVDLAINQRTASEEAQDHQKAVLEYNDTSSDEEDLQLEKYKSDSEESWGDDKFGNDSEQESDPPARNPEAMDDDKNDSSDDDDDDDDD